MFRKEDISEVEPGAGHYSGPQQHATECRYWCALRVCARTVLQDIAAACSETPECDFLVYYPLGRSLGAGPAQTPSGVLKTARAGANASRLHADEGDLLEPRGYDQRKSFNPLAVAYFKCARLSSHLSLRLVAPDLCILVDSVQRTSMFLYSNHLI